MDFLLRPGTHKRVHTTLKDDHELLVYIENEVAARYQLLDNVAGACGDPHAAILCPDQANEPLHCSEALTWSVTQTQR
jgi:hypothetical protein